MTALSAAAFAGPNLDINLDGVPDLLASSRAYDPADGAFAMVHVYDGRTADFVRGWRAAEQNDLFGYAVSAIGDVDADGVGDVAIGAPKSSLGGTDAGTVYIMSGASGAVLVEIVGAPHSFFGSSVRGVGDVTGDGSPDLLVTSFASVAGSATGQVELLSSTDWSMAASFMPASPDPSFGFSLSSTDDLNGDGLPDVAIGAPWATNASGTSGHVSVFAGPFGGAAASFTTDDALRVIPNPRDETGVFARALASGKDLDADGVRELVIASTASEADGHTIRLDAVRLSDGASVTSIADANFRTRGDVTGDQKTDTDDLGKVVQQWGAPADPTSPFPADTDADNVTSTEDLNTVLGANGAAGDAAALLDPSGVGEILGGEYPFNPFDCGTPGIIGVEETMPVVMDIPPSDFPIGSVFDCEKARQPGPPMLDGSGGVPEPNQPPIGDEGPQDFFGDTDDCCPGNGGNDPLGDRDGDGIPNYLDCDEPEYGGDPGDCDDDGDGIPNDEDCDSYPDDQGPCECGDWDEDGIRNQNDCDSGCYEGDLDDCPDECVDDGGAGAYVEYLPAPPNRPL